jgi:UPF0042 nucleotide-binding protein
VTKAREAARAAAESNDGHGRFIVLTGLSGAGKSQAIRALEDLGYFCVDNLPTALIPTLVELTRRSRDLSRMAVVVDVREGRFLSDFPRVYRALKRGPGPEPTLIFLEASDAALIRRFSETRRPHPLSPHGSAAEGIRTERARVRQIRRLADEILDTSDLTVHELRRAIMAMARGAQAPAALTLTLLSFGFKYGIPSESDLVFDVRFLPNPHFVEALRPLTGKDRPVVLFLLEQPATEAYLTRVQELLRFLIPQYLAEGKSYLTVSIGCTGGRHRSPMIAETLRRRLAGAEGARLRVRHRDIAVD